MVFWTIMLLIFGALGAYLWIRSLRWKNEDYLTALPSWEAQRRFEENLASMRVLNSTMRSPSERSAAEAERLRIEVERLREENRDLRANQATDDYRTVSRRHR